MNDPAERLYTKTEVLEIAKIYLDWIDTQRFYVDDVTQISKRYSTLLKRMRKYPVIFEGEISSIEKAKGLKPTSA